MKRQLTRREFFSTVGKGFIAAELIRLVPYNRAEAAPMQAADYPLAAVATGTNDDAPGTILQAALNGIGGIERFVHSGMSVVIKPNATWAYPPHTASSSDPELLRALIGLVRKAGAQRIIVMDHCSIDPGTAESVRVSGIGAVVKEEKVEGIFPDRTNAPLSTYTTIDLPNGTAFQKMGVIKAAIEADLRINLAMAKTHNVTKMSMCLKHMMGFLQAPGRLHVALEQGIADLSTPSPLQAQLHILEGLRVRLPYGSYRVCAGPETDITNPKVVKRWNQVIAGTDPVLIDSYGCVTYFDMQPEELPYLVNAVKAGIGTSDLQAALGDGRLKLFQVGSPISTPMATETAVATQVVASSTDTTPAPVRTSTPLPTASPVPGSGGVETVGIESNPAGGTCNPQEVVDPKPFLNLGLIPAAGVVAGAGLVMASRRRRKKPNPGSENKDEHGQEG